MKELISFKKEPNTPEELKELLNPTIKKWFFSKFKEFSLPQLYGVYEVHSRNNVLVSAPTGATKCLLPDETVLIKEKNFVRLVNGTDLVEKAKNGRLLKKIDKTGELKEINSLESFSLQKNGKIHLKKAFVYSETVNDKFLKIKTEYGREVKISKDHPLLVEGKGWVKACELKVDDKIAAPKVICLPENEIELNWKTALETLKTKSKIAVCYEDYLRLKIKTENFNNLLSLNSNEIKELLVLLRLSYNTLKKDLNISSVSTINRLIYNKTNFKRKKFLNYLVDKLKNVKFEENRIIFKTYGMHEFSFTYPKILDSNLARWLAFVLAEGIIGDYKKGTHLMISQKNRINLLNEFFSISKKYFDVSFKTHNNKDFFIYSTLFCYFITDLFTTKRGRGRYVELPQFLLNCKKNIRNNFLNVFFSLEAHVSKKEIVIYQSNKQKIEIINYMLLSNSIFSAVGKQIRYAMNTKNKTKREYYLLSIRQISNLKKFLKFIDIDHQNRNLLLSSMNKNPSGHYVNKRIFDYKKIRKLSKYYTNDLSFKKYLGNIYEVVRRTGYITEEALLKLKEKIKKFRDPLYFELQNLFNDDILWLRIKSISEFDYNGLVFDLNVPDIHNFIGGYGAIFLHNTLTSFLSILNELVDLAEKNLLENKIYCVYISPLKALNNDIYKNLIEPLKEIEKVAGREFPIRVAVRTGDTTQAERALMLKHVPHILITTPESVALLLSSPKFRENLKNVDWVIIDEIHSLAENKRGVHLNLSLERLQRLNPGICRIGLSATVAPIEEIAKFLVGIGRQCKIIDVQFIKQLDLKVLSPLPDLIDMNFNTLNKETYNLLDKLIQEHKTTLIFTNTRSGTERVVHHLKTKFPNKYTKIDEQDSGKVQSLIGAHHGSLSKDHRFEIEDALRKGKLRCVVCSTSLELGIDIGYIDLVICLGSPKSIARLKQRIGRSGHALHAITKGRIIVLDRDDLVECSVMLKDAVEHKIDKVHIPRNCLDVLAQQIFGIALEEVIDINELYNLIRKSYCYETLSYDDFMNVIKYLSGDFSSLEDRNVYAKIWFNENKIGKRGKLARVIYMTNIGTIPDESSVKVKVNDYGVGTVEEEFLEKLKKGDIFVLGGNTYEFKFSRGTVAQVVSAEGKRPTVPSWFSEMLPLSFDLATDIGKFRHLIDQKLKKDSKKEIIDFINEYLYVDKNAAEAIYNYFKEQHDFLEIPTYKKILIENYKDEKDKKYVIFHTLYGRRVNDVLSRALAYVIGLTQHRDVEISFNDNGFYLSYEKNVNVIKAFNSLKSKDLKRILEFAIDKSEVLKRRFRHCALRSLMILRVYKGRRKRVGRQQVSSMILMNAVKRISNDFVILKEARREIMEDLMDIENAFKIIEDKEKGLIEVKEVNSTIPSPFAFNLIIQGYSDVLKMEDRIEFLRRMHKMILAKISVKK